jgi:hypothetical protein
VTSTNVLYYLVKEGRALEAAHCRYRLAYPTLPAQLARRLCVEGCIELTLGRADLAEKLLADSAVRFTGLRRLFDATLALLYLAASCCQKENFRHARDHLTTAQHLAQACRHPIAYKIELLIEGLGTTAVEADEIRRIAFESGGCLGPAEIEAEADN